MFYTPHWEFALFTALNQNWRAPVLDILMPLISSPLFWWPVILAALGLAMYRQKISVQIILGLALALAISDASCTFIKTSVGRVRPYQSIAGTMYMDGADWVARPEDKPQSRRTGSSYPSAHASNAAAATMIIFLAFRRNKWIWVIPLLIGYSRLYLGKHFPTDVFFGWMLGAGIGVMLHPLYPALAQTALALWQRYRPRR